MAIAKKRALSNVIAEFKFQSQRDDCWSVCIHNILKELASRKDRPSLRMSESRLNRAMGYGGGYGALSIRIDRVRPNVNKLIKPAGYYLEEQTYITLAGL